MTNETHLFWHKIQCGNAHHQLIKQGDDDDQHLPGRSTAMSGHQCLIAVDATKTGSYAIPRAGPKKYDYARTSDCRKQVAEGCSCCRHRT